MKKLECTLLDFDGRVFFSNFVERAEFNTLSEGRVGVLAGHESMEFLIEPSYLTLKNGTVIEKFFIGSGFAKVEDDKLLIFAFPIFDRDDSRTQKQISLIEEYGKKCRKTWERELP
jgi:F0F1-type ATP synthase epsilon subunit